MRLDRPLHALLAAVTLSTVPLAAQDVYFPDPRNDWERRDPAAAGLDADRLREAVDFALEHESDATASLEVGHPLVWGREPFDEPIGPIKTRGPMTGIVVRHGYIVAEWGDVHRVDMTFSVTKSFLSTVVGLAWDRGMIEDVHDPVRLYLPTDHFDSEHNRKITWDHLLRQTSDWEGTLWDKPDWADRPDWENRGEWLTRERNEPGSVWKYNDVRVNVLALAATHVWREPLPKVLREHVMDPIGATNTWRWHGYENSWIVLDGARVQSVSGGGHWGGGMFLNALDQARFGYFTLRRGRWKGEQLLSDEWFAMALTPTEANPGYGFMNFFLNTGRESMPASPEAAYSHRGAGTNLIYVDPVHDLVVVARWIDRQAIAELIEKVLAAVVG